MDWLKIAGFAYYTLATVVAVGILMENRNPMKTMGFVVMLFLAPIGGLIVYFLFGQNYRKRRLFSRKGIRDNRLIQSWEREHLANVKEVDQGVRAELEGAWKVVNVLINSDRSVLTHENDLELLHNGDETFNRIFETLESAQHHIHVEYYIIEDDAVGRKFQEILIRKAKEGVEVRLIYDDVGSSGLKKRFLKPLHDAGVQARPFMPVIFPLLTSKANFRDHRKVIIVDGRYGFTGGINISERYSNSGKYPLYWRDTHLLIHGDAVKSLQLHFMLMWRFVYGSAPEVSPVYFPKVECNDDSLVQIVGSGPDGDWANIMSAIFTAICSAKRELLITTPYLIPTDEILMALQTASLSGVKIRIILPAKSDSKLVQAAMLSYVKELLEAGIEVYLYEKGFIHAKTIVVDGVFCTIGTSNMDYRSFDINFEVNAFVYSSEFSAQLVADFENDLKECRQITLERWEKRRLRRKVWESLARLFAPLL